ncbi:MAG: nucleotidyltransferase domain-containing protein [Candidatus Omnitrophota bacterium]
MVYSQSEIKNITRQLVKLLRKKIPVETVILFGSYAYGKPCKHSDIDLAVISQKFNRMNDIKRIMLLSDLTRRVKTRYPVDIDPLGFTAEELEKGDYFNITTIIREDGKIIYESVH